MRTSRILGWTAGLGGPLLVVLVAWMTSSIGDDPGGSIALANVALVLAFLTIAVALVSWIGGLTTSVAAALSLNWFHTEPYRTFRITSGRDVATVALLTALGVAVSTTTAWRIRRATRAGRAIGAARAQGDLAPLVGSSHQAHDLWHAAITATSPDLGLVSVRVVDCRPPELPVVARREWTVRSSEAEVVLPACGAAFPLRGDATRWIVLSPPAGTTSLTIDRRALTAFADTLELAIDVEGVSEAQDLRAAPAAAQRGGR